MNGCPVKPKLSLYKEGLVDLKRQAEERLCDRKYRKDGQSGEERVQTPALDPLIHGMEAASPPKGDEDTDACAALDDVKSGIGAGVFLRTFQLFLVHPVLQLLRHGRNQRFQIEQDRKELKLVESNGGQERQPEPGIGRVHDGVGGA